ncbi:hypothetical protein R1sor_012550 [Riccia sorocarpa]|uniref:DJ-1/PfpI domain-containing protein n=1 Tax=Riccia sorocarpa TaxID=122646 RepID=A0ABD3I7D5_9MARC
MSREGKKLQIAIPIYEGFTALDAIASFEEITSPDVIILPGGSTTGLFLDDDSFLSWIRKVHERTLYTTSVCTGSHLLAAAGLLKDLTATTHWKTYEVLEKYGAKPTDKRVVQEGKIITAAGVSSGIDMGLLLVSLLADEQTAKAIQLYIEYDPQPPFDSGAVSKATPEVIQLTESFLAREGKFAAANYQKLSLGKCHSPPQKVNEICGALMEVPKELTTSGRQA